MDIAHTRITSSWLPTIQWRNGWQALQAEAGIQQPSVWMVNPKSFFDQVTRQVEPILSRDESTRAGRFYQADHALRFKAAHTALRLVLASAIHANPAELRFERGRHNKPGLASPANTGVQFNVSYTDRRAIIGLNASQPIGVDIEWAKRPLAIDSMLEACFSRDEITFICAQAEKMQQRFFTLWTRKEAILKLTGEGIGEHLPHFEVLDGERLAKKDIIGGTPPDEVYLYSFEAEAGYIGCFSSPKPLTECFFYRL